MPDSLGCIGSEGEVGMVQLRDVSVCRRGLMEWWWGVRTQEPVLLGDGGRDVSGKDIASICTTVMSAGIPVVLMDIESSSVGKEGS